MHRASIQRVTFQYGLRRQAGLRDEFVKWVVQPLSTIVKHHREFIYGPIEDLMEEVFRRIAPNLLKQVAEAEIDADVDEFLDGATHGKWESERGLLADPPSVSDSVTEDYVDGYDYGYNHPEFSGDLPPRVRREVVEEAVTEFKGRMGTEVIEEILGKAWHAINPRHTLQAIIRAVKKHGWKLGLGFALFEVFEHFLLPSILVHLTGNPKFLALATLPIGEVVYAIIMPLLGRVPKDVDELTEAGHLDWYEEVYGTIRLASAFPPYDEWLSAYGRSAATG